MVPTGWSDIRCGAALASFSIHLPSVNCGPPPLLNGRKWCGVDTPTVPRRTGPRINGTFLRTVCNRGWLRLDQASLLMYRPDETQFHLLANDCLRCDRVNLSFRLRSGSFLPTFDRFFDPRTRRLVDACDGGGEGEGGEKGKNNADGRERLGNGNKKLSFLIWWLA